jgi:hypothetical protein
MKPCAGKKTPPQGVTPSDVCETGFVIAEVRTAVARFFE